LHRASAASGDDHADLPPHEVSRQRWQARRMTVRGAILNCNVLTFLESYLLQPLAKGGNPVGVNLKRDSLQKPDHWHGKSLRPRTPADTPLRL
jgi:hypothetical protein